MDFSLDEKIKLAMAMCEKRQANTHKFYNIYPFATENINGYLPLFDLKDKSLFTVGSSGDQAFNAILNGAKEITIFDLCPFTQEYYYLKKAAIKTLTCEEFLNFFCYKNSLMMIPNNSKAFDINVYLKIRDALKFYSLETEYFWDELFGRYNGEIIRNQLFSKDENKSKVIRRINNYLTSDNMYNELSNKMDSVAVQFIEGDIFSDQINGSFDNIFLSNLSSHYSLLQIKDLFDKMLLHLNDDGKMLVAYLYEMDMDSMDYMEGEAEIYNIPKTFEIMPKDIDFNSFIGVKGLLYKTDKIKDSVITYKKVKKI